MMTEPLLCVAVLGAVEAAEGLRNGASLSKRGEPTMVNFLGIHPFLLMEP